MFTLGMIALAALLALRPRLVKLADAALWRVIAPPWLCEWRFGAVLAIGTVVAALGTSVIAGAPFPFSHDEFSYLLLADTLASGRLANPTHPMWEHFETFHVIFQPSYASKYPPGQGIALAIGQLAFRAPIAGIFLTAGLAVFAVHWMLRQWLPGRWAALGAWLFVLQVGVASYWTHSFWGGHVAAIGGALVLGSVRRLVRGPVPTDACVTGVGIAILANSRPYEGAVLTVLCAVYFVARYPWHEASLARLTRPALAGAAVLAVAGLAMMTYNARITGDPFTFPYSVHQETYHRAPIFLFQETTEPQREPLAVMAAYHAYEAAHWARQRSLAGFVEAVKLRALKYRRFYLPWGFTVLGVGIVLLLGVRGAWAPLLMLSGCFGASLLPIWQFHHYTAPYAGLVYLVATLALQRLRLLGTRRWPFGRMLVALMFLAAFWSTIYQAVDLAEVRARRIDRDQVVAALRADTGRHLILVRTGKGHSFAREWVYNRADIDGSKVVWARDLGPDRNQALVAYFKDRQPWLLTYAYDEELTQLRLERYNNASLANGRNDGLERRYGGYTGGGEGGGRTHGERPSRSETVPGTGVPGG